MNFITDHTILQQIGGAFRVENWSASTRRMLGAALIACGLLTGCSFERCVPAETVRVKIQDTVYRLPAAFQPDIYSKELRTQFRVETGRHEYCQKPEDSPPDAEGFSLDARSLDRIAAQQPELSRLQGLDLVAVHHAPASHHPAENPSGYLVNDGLFRRVDHQGTFELFSTEPLLFGSTISAFCGRAPTQEPSISCDIWGQIIPGTLVRVQLVDTTHPFDDWPQTLAEVERLVGSFNP